MFVKFGITIGAILATSISFAATSKVASNEKLAIDTKESKIQWVGKKVTGQHTGTIGISTGVVEFKDKKLIGGQLTIDMDKITVLDVKNPSDNGKLLVHLKSEDFFDLKNHATSELKIKSVKNLSPTQAEVTAELTIRGKPNTLTFPVEYKFEGKKASATGKLEIDRTLYGVKYNSAKFFSVANLKDKVIEDKFELTFDLKASEQQAAKN